MSNALDLLYLLFIWPIEASMQFVLETSTRYLSSIGFAIILLSIVTNIILIPFSRLADKWMKKEQRAQKKLAPYIAEIKSVFKGQERFMMLETLYKQNHYHPLLAIKASAGLLIQIPFFIAAYQLLSHYSSFKGESFLFLSDLSAADSTFSIGTFPVHILPLIMTLINILSAYIYSSHLPSKDRSKQYVLAIIFLIVLYESPSALVLYWTLNNLFTLAKNIANKYYFKTDVADTSLQVEVEKVKLIERIKNSLKVQLNSTECLTVFSSTTFITCSLIYFFTPTSVYLSDPSSFSTSFSHIAKDLGLSFISISLPIILIFAILPLVIKRFFCVISTSIALSSCMYAFVFTGDYGALDFFQFQRNASIISLNNLIKDTFIFLSIYYLTFKLLKEGTKHSLMTFSFATLSAIIIASVINLFNISNITTHTSSDSLNNELTIPSYTDDLLSFSPTKNNVLVIMLDMFTGGHIKNIFAENPDIATSLDGFTWFPNTLSAGAATFQGEPGIHGGHQYTPYEMNKRNIDSIIDEINKSYAIITDAFGPKNYHISFAGVEYADCKSIEKYTLDYPAKVCTEREYEAEFFNYWLEHSGTTGLNVSNEHQASMLTSIGLFRISSYNFRPIIYQDGRWLMTLANQTSKMTLNGFTSAKKAAAIESFHRLSNSSSTKNTFKYIQSSITHYSWAHAKDSCEILSEDPYKDTQGVLEQVNGIIPEHYYAEVCALRALSKWFDWMKKEGVYDNTHIILVSDHGQGDSAELSKAFQLSQQTSYPGRAHALLMSKKIGSKGELKVDHSFMSNADTPSLFCSSIGGCKNISENYGMKGSSRFLHYTVGEWRPNDHDKDRYLGDFYTVKDNLFDPTQWEKLENE